MSTVNVDDTQYVPSNGVDQTQKPNGVAVIHQPQPNYVRINVPTMQNPSQYQIGPSLVDQNGQPIPVVFVTNSTNGHFQLAGDINNVPEYTRWSVFNIGCCLFVIGACALCMSIKTRNRKRMGDLQGARKASKWAAILNTIATVVGIIVIILNILQYTGQISI
jgi:hypothetical protein